MSWDMDIGCCPRCKHGRYEFNYTHNTNPMMREAGAGPEAFDGLNTEEASALMRSVIDKMEAEPEKYRAMNPENGWGSYNTLMQVLREILDKLDLCGEGEIVTVSM